MRILQFGRRCLRSFDQPENGTSGPGKPSPPNRFQVLPGTYPDRLLQQLMKILGTPGQLKGHKSDARYHRH